MIDAEKSLLPTLFSKIGDELNAKFGSGEDSESFSIGSMPDDPAWATAVQMMITMAKASKEQKSSMCDDLVSKLTVLGQPAEPKPRALPLSLYNQSLVLLMANRLDESAKKLSEAQSANDMEKDGVFSSHGKNLGWRISALREHLQDRTARERNNR
ncbi:MAG TPA: hypothetical protein DCS97_03085 [Planctomycetes bacterium]|nr:hypothetical protein [Planctomycetota bacterium]